MLSPSQKVKHVRYENCFDRMLYCDYFEIEGEPINLEELVDSAVTGDYDDFIYKRKSNSDAIQITVICRTSKVKADAKLERGNFIVMTPKMHFGRPNYKKKHA